MPVDDTCAVFTVSGVRNVNVSPLTLLFKVRLSAKMFSSRKMAPLPAPVPLSVTVPAEVVVD